MRLRELFFRVVPLALWLGMIYYASSQPYQRQDLRPFLREFDLSLIDRWFSWVSFTYSNTVISIETRGTAAFVEFFIRKAAHLFVFFVLGVLIFRFLKLFNLRLATQFASAILFILLFAAFDEYRQFLNPNRSGLYEDVIIDTAGGVLGILFATVFRKKEKRSKRNRKRGY